MKNRNIFFASIVGATLTTTGAAVAGVPQGGMLVEPAKAGMEELTRVAGNSSSNSSDDSSSNSSDNSSSNSSTNSSSNTSSNSSSNSSNDSEKKPRKTRRARAMTG